MAERNASLPQLWGPAEILAELGIAKATLMRWRERPDFPAPALELHMGPVWIAEDVRAWATSPTRDRRRRRGGLG